MKKIALFFLLVINSTIHSQNNLESYQDNYGGVRAVLYNPASISNTRFTTDVNLFSFGVSGTNDYYAFKVTNILNSDYNIETEAKTYPSNANNFIINADMMGPSVMLNILPKHSVAFFTRARVTGNLHNINGDLFNQLKDNINATSSFDYKAGNYNATFASWAEIGASYATILLNKEQHVLKGGVSFKFVQGIANSYSTGDNVSVKYTNNSPVPITNFVETTGVLTYGGTQNFEDSFNSFKFDISRASLGIDLGFIYEFKPKSDPQTNQYKYKFAFSITDIGTVNFKDTNEKVYDLNKTVTEAQYENANSFGEFLEANYTVIKNGSSTKFNLPTAAHLNLDWNLHEKIFINFYGDINLNNKLSINNSAIANFYGVTPRYESKWFTVSLPLNYMEYRKLQLGTGFRLGPVFIGSSSILSNLLSNESKGADFYFGFKVPIYKKSN